MHSWSIHEGRFFFFFLAQIKFLDFRTPVLHCGIHHLFLRTYPIQLYQLSWNLKMVQGLQCAALGLKGEKVMPSKNIKLQSHKSKGYDDLMGLIFCIPMNLIYILESPSPQHHPWAPHMSTPSGGPTWGHTKHVEVGDQKLKSKLLSVSI